MRFKLGNNTIRVILGTQHLNITSIILCFDIFFLRELYHSTIYAIILTCVHSKAEPFMLHFSYH